MAINHGSIQGTLTPRGVVGGTLQNATRAFVRDYDLLENKPSINNVELSGNKSLEDLGIENHEIVANPGETTENLTSLGIDGVNYNIQGSGGSAVTSVNGKTGEVTLDASDVGALPDDTPLFSGDYNDLDNKPTIPDELADLQDDSTHRVVTDAEKTAWNAKADISDLPTVNNNTITIQKNGQNIDSFTLNQNSNKSIDIPVPTKTSDLQNDNSFITSTVNNLANYYLKSDTYTQTEVNNLISAAVNGRFKKVTTLPASGEPNVIYLVPKTTTQTNNIYDEYIWQDNAWELLGSTEIDLSGYVTTTDLATALADYVTTSAFNTAIANYYTKTEVGNLLDGKVDKVNGKGLSTYDYDATAKGIVDNVTTNLAGKVDKVNGKGLSTNDYDNTAKGIVDSVTSNLANKVDKVAGKGLSTNDYDNTAKGIVDGVTSALANKVDKVQGKGLSTEDYTTAEKNKLNGIAAGAEVNVQSDWNQANTNADDYIKNKPTKVSDFTNDSGFTKVGSSQTNGNIKIDNVETQVYDDSSIQDKISTSLTPVSGNPISFATKSAQLAVEPVITFEPIQDLHGQSKPYPAGGGKNLIIYKIDDCTILPSGVLASDNAWDMWVAPITQNETYTITTDQGVYIGSFFASRPQIGSISYDGSRITNGALTFVAPITGYACFRTNADYSTAQCEKGNQATTFAPYENICPISGYDKIEVLSGAENAQETFLGGRNSGTGAKVDVNIRVTTSNFFKIEKDKKYAISAQRTSAMQQDKILDVAYNFWQNNSETTNTRIYDSTFQGKTDLVISYTSDTWLSITVRYTDDSAIDTNAVKLVIVDKTTDLSESLGQTVYGASYYPREGILKSKTEANTITIDGTANWGEQTSGDNKRYYCTGVASNVNENSTDHICNMAIIATGNNASQCYTVDSRFAIYAGNYGTVYLSGNVASNVTALKAMLNTTPLQICYTVTDAGEKTIQLTPHEIALSQGYNYISTNGTSISLAYHNGELATHADVEQAGETINALGNYVAQKVIPYRDGVINSNQSVVLSVPSAYMIIFYATMSDALGIVFGNGYREGSARHKINKIIDPLGLTLAVDNSVYALDVSNTLSVAVAYRIYSLY